MKINDVIINTYREGMSEDEYQRRMKQYPKRNCGTCPRERGFFIEVCTSKCNLCLGQSNIQMRKKEKRS